MQIFTLKESERNLSFGHIATDHCTKYTPKCKTSKIYLGYIFDNQQIKSIPKMGQDAESNFPQICR